MKYFRILTLVFLIIPVVIPSLISAQTIHLKSKPHLPEYVPNQLIVTYKKNSDLPEVAQLNQQHQGHIVKNLSAPGQNKKIALVQFPQDTDINNMAKQYQASPNVANAQPNYTVSAYLNPNDPYFKGSNPLSGYQWNLERIKLRAAWDRIPSRGLSSVRVAVIDSGAAFENYTSATTTYAKAPELSNVNFVSPQTFLTYKTMSVDCTQALEVFNPPIRNAHPNDGLGHGTHVTSTVAQATNNGIHAAGIADHVSIMALKVLEDQCGAGADSDVIDAINYAVANQAMIINLSLGGSEYDAALEQTITYAINSGVTVVAATGNDSTRTTSLGVGYPARFNGVIAVGASRYDNQRAYYSNYGTGQVTLLAPGGQIDTDDNQYLLDQNGDTLGDGIIAQTININDATHFTQISGPNYGYLCVTSSGYWDENCGVYMGTSMAAPHVTAVVALMKSVNVNLTPAQIKTILQNSAQKTVIPGYNSTEHGAGLLDADAVLAQVQSLANKPGDFDHDGDIDFLNFFQLISSFNQTSPTQNLVDDTLINLFDFNKLISLMWH